MMLRKLCLCVFTWCIAIYSRQEIMIPQPLAGLLKEAPEIVFTGTQNDYNKAIASVLARERSAQDESVKEHFFHDYALLNLAIDDYLRNYYLEEKDELLGQEEGFLISGNREPLAMSEERRSEFSGDEREVELFFDTAFSPELLKKLGPLLEEANTQAHKIKLIEATKRKLEEYFRLVRLTALMLLYRYQDYFLLDSSAPESESEKRGKMKALFSVLRQYQKYLMTEIKQAIKKSQDREQQNLFRKLLEYVALMAFIAQKKIMVVRMQEAVKSKREEIKKKILVDIVAKKRDPNPFESLADATYTKLFQAVKKWPTGVAESALPPLDTPWDEMIFEVEEGAKEEEVEEELEGELDESAQETEEDVFAAEESQAELNEAKNKQNGEFPEKEFAVSIAEKQEQQVPKKQVYENVQAESGEARPVYASEGRLELLSYQIRELNALAKKLMR